MMKARIFGVVLWAVLAPLASADAIDDVVNAEMKSQKIPGLALGVFRNGKPIRMQGYGSSNLELGTLVDSKSVFKIASVSKHFVSSAVLKLVAEGKVGLDDSIRKHLSDAPETWQPITIRHLMSHTSGLPREIPGWDALKTYDEETLRKMAFATSPSTKPGDAHLYCNTGYFVLGFLISEVAKRPWHEYMNQALFAPLGMTSTRMTSDRDLIPGRVDGYVVRGEAHRNAGPLLSTRTSGCMVSNLEDFAKWEEALFNEKVLPAELQREAWTVQKLNNGRTFPYGFGWGVHRTANEDVVAHSGSYEGFRSYYWRSRSTGVSIVVLCNVSGGSLQGLIDQLKGVVDKRALAAKTEASARTKLRHSPYPLPSPKPVPPATPPANP